jgi:GT2 family glycosyltransferase
VNWTATGRAFKQRVSVTIVTHNSASFVDSCLDSVFSGQSGPLEVIVVDNASGDGTRERLRRYEPRARVFYNERNTGFAAGQNQAIAASRGDWVLTLNPDVRLEPHFIDRLVEAGGRDPRVGTVCGKLRRWLPESDGPAVERIDSTGIYFTPEFRHFDRGWNEPDDGRYDRSEYVFGACAAAALYRREMIRDTALADGFFDPDFFTYREDADVAWRAQLLGWRCLYVPEAVAYHVRRLAPDRRRSAPASLRMHSVKNRFLMRIKNVTWELYRRHWVRATARDLMVLAGCLLAEPRSLAGFWHLARALPRALEKRRHLMRRRRVADDDLAQWFADQPVSRPFEEEFDGACRQHVRASRHLA